MNKKEIINLVNHMWYAQGVSGTPLLMVPFGNSAFDLTPAIEDTFSQIMYEWKEEYGKMFYPVEELNKLSKKILEKVNSDPHFLSSLKSKYEDQFNQTYNSIFPLPNLKEMQNDEFIDFLKHVIQACRDSVGIGHIVEPFALTTDVTLKEKLLEHLEDKKQLAKVLSLLTTPTIRSFINEREEDLYRIFLINEDEQRESAIKDHINKFYWVKNTYSGRKIQTVDDIKLELSSFKNYSPVDFDKIKKAQENLVKRLTLSEDLLKLIEATKFITILQDVRKKNILKAIDVYDKVIEELAARLNLKALYVKYLSPAEVDITIFQRNNLLELLKLRRQGTIHLTTANDEGMLIGKEQVNFHQQMSAELKKKLQTKEISGMAASTGFAMGRVKICLNHKDIENFQEGDVLVASMTRPEYVTAMKKAIAIITDEGGITCHAAIVSRELGIPCVIGTKIATKVLKDGDLVEVKANHGLIIVREN